MIMKPYLIHTILYTTVLIPHSVISETVAHTGKYKGQRKKVSVNSNALARNL